MSTTLWPVRLKRTLMRSYKASIKNMVYKVGCNGKTGSDAKVNRIIRRLRQPYSEKFLKTHSLVIFGLAFTVARNFSRNEWFAAVWCRNENRIIWAYIDNEQQQCEPNRHVHLLIDASTSLMIVSPFILDKYRRDTVWLKIVHHVAINVSQTRRISMNVQLLVLTI